MRKLLLHRPLFDITSVPTIENSDSATTLVIYFSTNDTVKTVALNAADAIGADVFEVMPEQPYMDEDLAYYTDGRIAALKDIPFWPLKESGQKPACGGYAPSGLGEYD